MTANGPRRFAANTAWLVGAQLAGKVASLVFFVVVARALSTREFGYFSFALAFVPLFLVLGGFGLESTVIRGIARDRSRLEPLFATGLALRLALGAAGLLVALVVAPLLVDGFAAYAVVAVVGIALLLDEITGFVGTVFRAFEQMRYHALAVFVNRIVSTTLAVGAAAVDAGLLAVCLTYLAGSAGALAFSWLALRRHFPPVALTAGRRAEARELVAGGAPLGAASVLNSAVLRIDSVLLQGLRGPVEVGLYGVAYRVFESLLFFAWSVGNAALPVLSRARDGAGLRRVFELSTALALAFYLPVAVVLPFAADWLVTTVFSERYAEAATALALLSAAAAPYAVAFLGRVAAIALGRVRQIVVIAAIALTVNVALNLWAIREWGFEGAAGVTLVTELVEAALLVGLVARATGVTRPTRATAVPVLASAALGGVLILSGFDGVAALAVSALVYPATLAAAGWAFAPNEARLALGLVHRRLTYD